jgi:NADPH:quinone reductase-like Zn-dependent oxidoreductase
MVGTWEGLGPAPPQLAGKQSVPHKMGNQRDRHLSITNHPYRRGRKTTSARDRPTSALTPAAFFSGPGWLDLGSMKAVFRTRYGPPDVLEVKEVPKPQPRAGEVLVRVHAATVNRTDCAGLWGAPLVYRFFTGLPRPKHTATGSDFAGEVEAVGKDVTAFRVGDRVWGFDDNGAGTHAQYVTFAADKAISTIPTGLEYAQAAACAEGAHYAINGLRMFPLEGQRQALVNGATGAIGSAAVQLLKNHGVHVTAVCATPHVALVQSLGADRVIDYLQGDFTSEDIRYDFVFDAVGKSSFGACKPILKPDGIYISSELGPRAENLYLALLTPLRRGKKVRFPFPIDIKGSLSLVRALVEQGKFRPLIDRSYRLEQIRDAFTYVASGQKIGNVILTMS